MYAAMARGDGLAGSLGLSVQDSGGWADLPVTTRPPQRVQPEAAAGRITTGRDRQSRWACVPVYARGWQAYSYARCS